MMHTYPLTILMALVLSGLAMILMPNHRARKITSLLIQGAALFLSAWGLHTVVIGGPFVLTIGPYPAPWGITLNIGSAEAFLAMLFIAVSLCISWYGYFSLSREVAPDQLLTYPSLYHMSLAAVLGILFTGDLFNSFVFLEVSGLSACGMIIVSSGENRVFSALKYLILGSLGSGLTLMGIAYLYAITGHLNLHFIHLALMQVKDSYPTMLLISLALFMTGLGLKSAIFPLHIWLPDAYESAPTPTSAFFSALASKAPAILLFKLFFGVYGASVLSGTQIPGALMVLGASGMIIGSLMARKQALLKRMLAYSSVAQMGYIFLGMGIGAPLGIPLALYHMVAHSLSKACIFLTAGSFIEQTGETSIQGFKGIGREMPYTLGFFTLSALSMIGIPLLPGFVSKFNLALASLEIGKPWLLAAILFSSLLNASYYFPVIINGYFGTDNLDGKVFNGRGKPLKELAPLMTLSFLMVLAGLFSGTVLEFFQNGFFSG